MTETIALVRSKNCYGCHACADRCPTHCIRMEENTEGFLYPTIDDAACMRCGKCAAVCPALHPVSYPFSPEAYGAANPDAQIRAQASSGGVFYALAKAILSQNGVVFGVKFDPNFSAEYAAAQTEEEALAFCGSKYMQSDIHDCLPMAKTYLENGRVVLFTGTPCQIAGLKQFLGKDYDNLYTADLICSGVSSPKLWQKYLQSFRRGMPKYVSFRDKSSGWSKYNVKIEFESETYLRYHREDAYMQMFLDGLSIRECCYECGFRSRNIAADLTLADFWGVDKVMPALYSEQGVSLVLAHTDKGKALLQKCSDTLALTPVDAEQALNQNPFSSKSHKRNPRKDKYLNALPHKRFDYLYQNCYQSSRTERFKTIIASWIGYKP